MKHVLTMTAVLCALFSLELSAEGRLSAVPEPFRGFDPGSTYVIKYDDVDGFLKAAVVDVGRSTREKAEPTQPKIGTRMKVQVKRETVNEGNRFLYEAFEDEESNREYLKSLRASLEEIPGLVPLELFSRNEQLAYWLNLYNITLLDEIVAVYPRRNLKKLLVGRKSKLEEKLLTVAGIPLSLNDIHYTILRQNYDNNPLIIYGLYQGIIGGPNIRKRAYHGERVFSQLENNAAEFINSNRGTYTDSETVFSVSILYDRNREFFPNFEADLKAHLLTFLEGEERAGLQSATRIKPNIEDWTVTDLYGSYREIGGSVADNNAALLDAVQSVSPDGEGGVFGSNFSAASSQVQTRAPQLARFSPQLIDYLTEIKLKQEATYMTKGTVTVEELGEAPQPAEQEQKQEQEQE
jgi:hypothetical protein